MDLAQGLSLIRKIITSPFFCEFLFFVLESAFVLSIFLFFLRENVDEGNELEKSGHVHPRSTYSCFTFLLAFKLDLLLHTHGGQFSLSLSSFTHFLLFPNLKKVEINQ